MVSPGGKCFKITIKAAERRALVKTPKKTHLKKKILRRPTNSPPGPGRDPGAVPPTPNEKLFPAGVTTLCPTLPNPPVEDGARSEAVDNPAAPKLSPNTEVELLATGAAVEEAGVAAADPNVPLNAELVVAGAGAAVVDAPKLNPGAAVTAGAVAVPPPPPPKFPNVAGAAVLAAEAPNAEPNVVVMAGAAVAAKDAPNPGVGAIAEDAALPPNPPNVLPPVDAGAGAAAAAPGTPLLILNPPPNPNPPAGAGDATVVAAGAAVLEAPSPKPLKPFPKTPPLAAPDGAAVEDENAAVGARAEGAGAAPKENAADRTGAGETVEGAAAAPNPKPPPPAAAGAVVPEAGAVGAEPKLNAPLIAAGGWEEPNANPELLVNGAGAGAPDPAPAPAPNIVGCVWSVEACLDATLVCVLSWCSCMSRKFCP